MARCCYGDTDTDAAHGERYTHEAELETDRELCGAIGAPDEYAACAAKWPRTTTTTEAMESCFVRATKWLRYASKIKGDVFDECVIEEAQTLKCVCSQQQELLHSAHRGHKHLQRARGGVCGGR